MTTQADLAGSASCGRSWRVGISLVLFLITAGLIIAGGLFAARLQAAKQSRRQAEQMVAQTRVPLPEFRFLDVQGKPVTKEDLSGQIWVAACFFTRCRTVCPRIMATLRQLQEKLRDMPDVRLVSITVDPDYDRPEVLGAYAAAAGADAGRWLFLTGQREEIHSFVREGLRLAAAPTSIEQQQQGADPLTHSSRLVLVDRQGHLRGYAGIDDPWQMTLLLHAIDILRESDRSTVQDLSGRPPLAPTRAPW